MRRLVYLLLVVPLWTAAASDGDRNARAWLERMVEAVKTLNYEGTFVYSHGEQLEAMRIVHATDAAGEHERLVSLNGAAREIIRDDDLLTCILPDSRSVVVEKSRPRKYIPEGLLDLGDSLGRYYQFMALGTDRVAGRAAQIIAIKPRDRYRYGYRLWLDRESGMLLQSDLLDETGRSVEQMMFTELRIRDEIPPSLLEPGVSAEGYRWYREERPPRRAGDGQWKVESLPPGFMMSMHTEHGMPTSSMPVEHLVFTDGLSSVSVYVEKPGADGGDRPPFRGVSHMGAVSAFGTMVAGHQVTVVGEVPEATVTMIGKSVRYVRGREGD
ncbi:MAG: hypothetical protein GWO16_16075 [Gammaproteobacteria bacterium]|nr:hypothetical protein [Gammaproteobacteria bacterium]NIR32878.1 hypothetical protein [Gammaproteobacteria bacterium]NIR99424.1 hypothetical protein [Gammaproteobacteria bacterium]NIT65038.1 hypothetical protein [Gammaproteobacteria bacterium]NIV21953.1 hypothetical protein [Gammaproteobacteria bacterium]